MTVTIITEINFHGHIIKKTTTTTTFALNHYTELCLRYLMQMFVPGNFHVIM